MCALAAGANSEMNARTVIHNVAPEKTDTGPVLPKRWTHEDVVGFVNEAVGGKLKGAAPAIEADTSLDGAKFLKMSAKVMERKLGISGTVALKLFAAVREEVDRCAKVDAERRKLNAKQAAGR